MTHRRTDNVAVSRGRDKAAGESPKVHRFLCFRTWASGLGLSIQVKGGAGLCHSHQARKAAGAPRHVSTTRLKHLLDLTSTSPKGTDMRNYEATQKRKLPV